MRNSHPEYAAIGLCVLPAVVTAIWLRAFRLQLEAQEFVYTSIRTGTKRVNYGEIVNLEASGPAPKTGNILRSRLQLVSDRYLSINWKVFPREAALAFKARVGSGV